MVRSCDFLTCFGSDSSDIESQEEALRVLQLANPFLTDIDIPDLTKEKVKHYLGRLYPMIVDQRIDTASCALLLSCTIAFHGLHGPNLNVNEEFQEEHVTNYRSTELGSNMQFYFRLNGYDCKITSLHTRRFNNDQNIYIDELRACQLYDTTSGKSNATFSITKDGYFIIKAIQKTEYDTFEMYGHQYLEHIQKRMSCLNQPRGVYEVVVRGEIWYLMVTDAIRMRDHADVTMYDLKGLTLNRRNSDNVGTRLDQNFIEDATAGGFSLTDQERNRLMECLRNDTSFLQSINVMDYSLLVAWSKSDRVIVYGLIDYLRRFTPDKFAEFLFKSVRLLPKLERPTVIPPRYYGSRLTKFVQKRFCTITVSTTNEGNRSADSASPPSDADQVTSEG